MANPVNPTDPMKFFAYELAATSKFKDEKWILTGSFNQEKIQDCVFDFIKRFVLCKSCIPILTLIYSSTSDILICSPTTATSDILIYSPTMVLPSDRTSYHY